METSVKAPEVLGAAQSNVPEDGEGKSGTESPKGSLDLMEEFSKRLDDIVSTYGSAASLLDKQIMSEAETEMMKKEAKGGIIVAMETEVSLVMQSLKKLSSPAAKLDDLARKHAELSVQRRGDDKKMSLMQQKLSVLLDERTLLQTESRRSLAARGKLEGLFKELQGQYNALREETLRRCAEDEEKRTDMTDHFQKMLSEIQQQIEQQSDRNERLCRENGSLTDKLEKLMTQCEAREESLEKINQRRDLQNKLTEAKLQQATAQLTEAEDKHRREKEYLLRETIDKTKKCYAMKEQELSMKKKLNLYGQKFDEFQATLAKSNEIYVRFKKEMEIMTEKMKTMDKESNLWKTRFENCNKALNDMMEERKEKSKEYDVFVLKIQKLELLCRTLQTERGVLYDKIKEVRKSNANITIVGLDELPIIDEDLPTLLTAEELQEIEQKDPALTEGMSRLKEQQARLDEMALSLFGTTSDKISAEKTENDSDNEEDLMAAAFGNFTSNTAVNENHKKVDSVAEKVAVEVAIAETSPPTQEKVVHVSKSKIAQSKAGIQEVATPEIDATKKSEVEKIAQMAQNTEKTAEKKSQQPKSEQKVAVESNSSTQEEVAVVKAAATVAEATPVAEMKAESSQSKGQSATPNVNTPKAAAAESSKKQTPKKKKKRNAKNAS